MPRPHITVVNYYSVFPFDNGGKLATRDLYRKLTEWFDVTIVCVTSDTIYGLADDVFLSKHLNVVHLMLPDKLKRMQQETGAEYNLKPHIEPIYVLSLFENAHLCAEFVDELCGVATDSVAIIAEHVYTYRLVKAVAERSNNIPVIYRAQNVEYDYKRATWNTYNVPDAIYKAVFELEKECCTDCSVVLTITDSDKERFCALYGISEDKVLSISAGYNADEVCFVLPSKREKRDGRKTALYLSSSAQVAVDAAERIVHNAPHFPDIDFVIAGSVGYKITVDSLPANVRVLGMVSDEEKKHLLETSAFALNPISGGSGLNIKMLEYFASGVPVISTEFGARGISVKNGVHCLLFEYDSLKEGIQQFCKLDMAQRDRMAAQARKLIIDNHSWRSSALKVADYLQQILQTDFISGAVPLADIELIISNESPPIIPSGNIYIYGAGQWGKACLSFLSSYDTEPAAFLDMDESKWGLSIDGIYVESPHTNISPDNDNYYIFALTAFFEPIELFISSGVSTDRIIIAVNGNKLFRLSDGKGCIPYYLDLGKIHKGLGL